jgi:hypothetical protein
MARISLGNKNKPNGEVAPPPADGTATLSVQPVDPQAAAANVQNDPTPVSVDGTIEPAVTDEKKAAGRNVAQAREDRIQKAIEGKTFTYVGSEKNRPFECICGTKGKNPHSIKDQDGNIVLVGGECLKRAGVEKPVRERTVRGEGGGKVPSLTRQQKFSQKLAEYEAPFTFKEFRTGSFTCLCGGKGQHQIVTQDKNGRELAVGERCAELLPGLQLPAKESKKATGKSKPIAGLKGQSEELPDFETVG